MPNILSKIFTSFFEVYKTFAYTPTPRLMMTLLVKNEEQMLAHNIEFHHRMGVDAFIITDNNSTDRTPEIIEFYKKKGWVVEVISEKGCDYEQKKWVDRMIWLAKTKYHADWVINADADEFWYTPKQNLKKEMCHTHANVLSCEMRSVYPSSNSPWTTWKHTVRYVDTPEKYDLSLYSVFEHQYKKVIHRTAGYIQISMGNHKVIMNPKNEVKSSIIVYHYNVKLYDQFVKKMVNGGKQLEKHKSKHGGRHWRYFNAMYKENPKLLESEYQRVIGSSSFDKLKEDGYIFDDNPIPNYIKKISEDLPLSHAL